MEALMKLTKVQILNYKIIHDTEEFTIDDITCLVGKNESGKTAILQALTKLRPVLASDGIFDELEFPRMTYHDYSDENRPKEVLKTEWILDDEEIRIITDIVGETGIGSRLVSLEKGYDNKLKWSINLNYSAIVTSLLKESTLYDEEKKLLSGCKNTTDLFASLKSLQSPSENQAEFLKLLNERFPKGGAMATVEAKLEEWLPTFLYFGNYDLMRGRVSLAEFKRRKAAGQFEMSDRIFESLLVMAGSGIDEISGIAHSEKLIAKLEAVSNRMTRQIFEYWSQNKHLAIDFRFDTGRPEDTPPFNSGEIFHTRIKNQRHGATVPFDERSTGFVWFFSFLVWFSQVKEKYEGDLILLLDEPGLNLHAKAQSDLLRYFRDKLAPHHQVIYTTHSPFMIDPERLLSVRLVEDKNKDEEVLGTKVSAEVLRTDRDTIFPLQAALGYEIAQTLFVGKNVLLVEGPGDILFLQWFSDQLRQRKRIALDPRWTIAPGGGLDKIGSFISLFAGKGIHVAVLTDYGQGDKKSVQRLRDSEVLLAGHVLTVDEFAGQPEADIEDVLGRDLYLSLIHKLYKLAKKNELPSKRPETAPIRVLKEVEEHFRTLPTSVPEFDHYSPARFLMETPTVESDLSGFDAALDRFERLFKSINGLLP
jgi:energy-coupling factor transporter ATP-binding protein EcfA2